MNDGYVSTGRLPTPETVQALVEEAHARFTSNDEGQNAQHYPALARAQLQWLRRKYADQPPHAVVAFGTSTARRLELLDGPLFPGVPNVFAALDPLLFPDLVLPPDSDALWLRYDVGETLSAALRLQPAARRVVLISGTADFDRAMLALARREVAPYAQRVTIEEITDLPLEEVLRRVATLPPEAVVLYLSLNL
ncbi:MAG TPA: hypothetical protein VH257_19400, partial [Chloroflexota bacterium]|nr:hypothetical protein [Chloroflexota bacterium]